MSLGDWNGVKEEATFYLSKLIQIETTTKLQNEMDAILYLAKIAEENGLQTSIQKTAANRGNIIISLKKEYDSPVVLLSHVDVVPANAEDWKVPPFNGEVVNEEIWGRGTIDTKQLTITHLMILILLKRNGIDLKRDIVMVATSDEESGSRYGLLPFIQENPGFFNQTTVFNEGGGFPILIGDRAYYLCETGQKGRAIVKINAKGQTPSNSYLPDQSSLQTILQVIQKLKHIKLNDTIPSSTKTLFETIASEYGHSFSELQLDDFLELVPEYQSLLRAMASTTVTVTKWDGGRKHPILRGEYELHLDCRPVPSISRSEFENWLDTILDGLPVECSIESYTEGFETTLNQSHLALFEKELKKEVPHAKVVPFLSIGGSDSKHVVSYASHIYGYCPMLPDMTFDRVIKMVHGVDERIPLDSFMFGIKNLYRLLVGIGGEEDESNGT